MANTSSSTLFDNTTQPDLDDLWQKVLKKEEEEVHLKLPTFFMLGTIMGLGVPGNIYVLLVYKLKMKHSAFRVFVLCMAAYDLTSCAIGIPFEIVDLHNDITLDNAVACQIFRFVITFCTCGTVTTLVAVSLERYRRVCRPHGFQLTVRHSWFVSGISSFIALAAAVPALVFYGVKTEIRYGLELYDCSIADKWGPPYQAVAIYQVALASIWIVSILILVVVYTRIIVAMKRRNEWLRKLSDRTPRAMASRLNSSNSNVSNGSNIDISQIGTNIFSTGVNLNSVNAREAQTSSNVTGTHGKELISLRAKGQSLCPAPDQGGDGLNCVANGQHDVAEIQGYKSARKESAVAASFMRLFSRDANPLGRNQSPTLQNDGGSKPIPQQKHKGPYRTAPRDCRGPEAINTVWEDEGNAEDGWHCAVGDAADFNVDSVSPTQRFQGRNPHLFMRQESLNNYYQSATNTPNESLDGLSEDGGQNGDEEEKEEDQALAHESSTSMCRSWDAFNSIEGGDSNPTLNNSGSLEAIKPLAGNLQKKPKASGFEIAVTSVEFHLGANGDRNNSVLSFGHSCSAIDSTDSSSKAAHWGSQSALNTGSVSIDNYGDRESFSISNYSRAEISKPDEDREAGGVGKRGKWCKQETHAAKLGHRPDCARLCVSDYLTLSESEAGRCCVCRDCSSLPSFTEELHRQKLCPLTMKRAFSAPSLPSLPEINTCNYQCRQKYAVRTANPDRHCEDEVQRRYTEICPSPYKHLDVNTNSLSLQRTPLPSQTKTGEGTQFRQSLSEDTDKAESSVDIKRHYKKLAVFLPTEADIRLCNYDGSQPSRHLNTLSTNRLTNTMLGVTLGSVVSFLPHLFVQIFRGLRPDTVEYLLESSSTYFVIHHLCMRSFFANNALNPVIYSFTNDTFNKKGKSLLRSWAFAVLNKFGCGDCVYLEQDFNSSHMDETG